MPECEVAHHYPQLETYGGCNVSGTPKNSNSNTRSSVCDTLYVKMLYYQTFTTPDANFDRNRKPSPYDWHAADDSTTRNTNSTLTPTFFSDSAAGQLMPLVRDSDVGRPSSHEPSYNTHCCLFRCQWIPRQCH